MTDNEINTAIARACGWTHITPDTIQYTARRADGKWDLIPDYCNDLNAMHEAEQLLWNKNWSLRHEFVNNLARIMNPIHGYRMQEAIDLLDATARQRAEAFLKTIEKFN